MTTNQRYTVFRSDDSGQIEGRGLTLSEAAEMLLHMDGARWEVRREDGCSVLYYGTQNMPLTSCAAGGFLSADDDEEKARAEIYAKVVATDGWAGYEAVLDEEFEAAEAAVIADNISDDLDAEDLRLIGEAVFGASWQRELSRQPETNVNERTVQRWAAGDEPVSGWVRTALALLCRRRGKALMAIAARLGDGAGTKIAAEPKPRRLSVSEPGATLAVRVRRVIR